MSKETTQTDFRYIKTMLIPFIKENGDRRVSAGTLSHYFNFFIQRNEMDRVIISESCENDRIMAISVATVRNNTHVHHSTTVTHKSCRQKGYGTKALKAKMEKLKECGLGIKTIIAEDNIGAMKLCAKVGMEQVEKREKTRATGPFTAVLWAD